MDEEAHRGGRRGATTSCARPGADGEFGKRRRRIMVPDRAGLPSSRCPAAANSACRPCCRRPRVRTSNQQCLGGEGAAHPRACSPRATRAGQFYRRRGLPHGRRGPLHRARHHVRLRHRTLRGSPVALITLPHLSPRRPPSLPAGRWRMGEGPVSRRTEAQ